LAILLLFWPVIGKIWESVARRWRPARVSP